MGFFQLPSLFLEVKLQITSGSSTFNPLLGELCFVYIRVSADWISWSRCKFLYQDDVTYFTVGSSNYLLYLIGVSNWGITHTKLILMYGCTKRIKYPQRSFLYTMNLYTKVHWISKLSHTTSFYDLFFSKQQQHLLWKVKLNETEKHLNSVPIIAFMFLKQKA